MPYPGCTPDALGVVAHLAGLDLPDPGGWRVLDLGCADAGNLLAIKQALPRTTCVGIDRNAASIERGRAQAAQAGLDVRLDCADLLALPADLGRFDAVLVHGVWSWVPATVREALPGILAGLLAPQGIAYVSYLALPGMHLLAPARDVARRRARRAAGDPAAQVAAIRASLEETIVLRGTAGEDVYTRLLAAEAARWRDRPDFLLFHDILDPDATAFALEDLAALCAPAGLAWLGENLPTGWWRARLVPERAARLRELAGEDPVARQQLFDDIQAPVFKASLFVHADTAPRASAEPDPSRVLDLLAATVPGRDPIPRDADEEALLAVVGPGATPVAEVVDRAGLEPARGADAVLRLAGVEAVELRRAAPSWALVPGERPAASPLARAQATAATRVSTLRHRVADLEANLTRALLQTLDGTRTREEVVAELARVGSIADADRPVLEAHVDAGLGSMAEQALLLR